MNLPQSLKSKPKYVPEPSSLPEYFQPAAKEITKELNDLPSLNNQIEAFQREFVNPITTNQRKAFIVNLVGIQALRQSTEGSQIFHVHRWTKHKKIPDSQSFVEVLRCRRCELMKSVELYTERDKSGRIVMKRLDRYVEAIDTQPLSGDKKIEHNNYYRKRT